MTGYKGGDVVQGGFFWNRTKWDATYVEGRSGVLPGEPGERFVRIPVIVALLAAPLMGALFVMFLPFIGIALMVQHMAKATGLVATRASERVSPMPTGTGFDGRADDVQHDRRDDGDDRR